MVGNNLGVPVSSTDTSTGVHIGGLVGRNDGTVSGSAQVRLVVKNKVGGLVGLNKGTVNGFATGSVSGAGDNVGGLVGGNQGSVSGYATGAVTVADSGFYVNVGGLVGGNSSKGSVSGYATGPVSGRSRVGGLVGGK